MVGERRKKKSLSDIGSGGLTRKYFSGVSLVLGAVRAVRRRGAAVANHCKFIPGVESLKAPEAPFLGVTGCFWLGLLEDPAFR